MEKYINSEFYEDIRRYFYLDELYFIVVNTFPLNHKVTDAIIDKRNAARKFLLEKEVEIDEYNTMDIYELKLPALDLKEECGCDLKCNFGLKWLIKKSIYQLTHREMNYMAYVVSDVYEDLTLYPRYWTPKKRKRYMEICPEYIVYRRNLIVDSILK